MAINPNQQTTIDISSGYSVPEDGWYRIIIKGIGGVALFQINGYSVLYAENGEKYNGVLLIKAGTYISRIVEGESVVNMQKLC